MHKTALFEAGRMDEKRQFFTIESRVAHDQITNMLILTYPLLVGVWQFRETAKHFAHLAGPVDVKNSVLDFINFPQNEGALRRLDFTESITKISWQRQRDAAAEMLLLVAFSIYESYAANFQDLISGKSGISLAKQVEKGVQFPSNSYDFDSSPPSIVPSVYSNNFSGFVALVPICQFMKDHLLSSFPVRAGRNLIHDFEQKLQTYLLFKKFRNSLVHGRFDQSIIEQYKIVDLFVEKEAQGHKSKISLLKDSSGNYSVSLFQVIGFTIMLLRMIGDLDFLYAISVYGERDLIERLGETKDSKQSGSSRKREEFQRLRMTIAGLGLPHFTADEAAIDYFVNKYVWRR